MLQDQLKSGEKKENKFAGFYRDNSSFTLHGSDILLAVKQKDSSAWSGRPYLEYRPNTGKRIPFSFAWFFCCDFLFQDHAQNSTPSVSWGVTPEFQTLRRQSRFGLKHTSTSSRTVDIHGLVIVQSAYSKKGLFPILFWQDRVLVMIFTLLIFLS